MKRVSGFTLLEVLIAISIFAIVGLSSYQLLTVIIGTHERVRTAVDEYEEVSRAMGMIERDFYGIVDRPVRDEYGEPLPALIVGGGRYPIELTRSGWNNPAGLPRSNLQRVAYSIENDGQLVRHFWLVLDRAEDSTPIDQPLLSDITDFRINLIMLEGDTTDSWPSSSVSPLPSAIEVVVATKRIGEIRRLIPVISPAIIAPTNAPDGDDGGVGA